MTNQIIRKYIFQEYARMTPIKPFSVYVCSVPPSSDNAIIPQKTASFKLPSEHHVV